MKLVIIRPEPGASATRRRAEAEGWETAVVPLHRIEARPWTAPDAADFDAVLMTSANAAGEAGRALGHFTRLPLYAVGEATAKAARGAGFDDIVTGAGGAATIADRLRAEGRRRILHLAGEEVRAFDESGLDVVRIAVYASVPITPDGFAAALAGEPVALLHSPRAARRFAALCESETIDRTGIALAAISTAALTEAGAGWRAAASAATPDDAALLAAACALCGGEAIG